MDYRNDVRQEAADRIKKIGTNYFKGIRNMSDADDQGLVTPKQEDLKRKLYDREAE